MIASKPGYQLHAQFIPFQSFANNGRWRLCRRRTKTKTKIKESVTSWMTLNTVIMVTRTELLFVADIHINACTFIIYNEQNYKCRNQFFIIFTVKFYSCEQYTNLMKAWKLVHAYVYSQWWYCADRSYAFLNMGGVRSRKYGASISDRTTAWGLRWGGSPN